MDARVGVDSVRSFLISSVSWVRCSRCSEVTVWLEAASGR